MNGASPRCPDLPIPSPTRPLQMSPSKSATAAGSDMPAPTPGGYFGARLDQTDPELAAAIRAELRRQQDQIEMIASENIVSSAVLEAQGSVLTNNYAEGYPGRR